MHIYSVNQEELTAYLASLPVDDEELTQEELDAVAEGERALARGDVVAAEEIALQLMADVAKRGAA